ncbi:MAG TPA: AzlC family ABC transporter permease [Candidatus Binatia bacterium]|jgi:4-azaleucine resistance transporter AzlC|nr:AzlC family ABC transporter permease [Candidatus Binatia bacterium]
MTGVPPRGFRDGLVASLALVPSVFVYGTVFGGLAVQAGLRPLEVWAMSVVVFAGAAQFVAVPMLAAGASPLAVVLTTYVINLRHYLMAATLAPSFRAFPHWAVALVAHVLNDESFAVAVSRSRPRMHGCASAARRQSAARSWAASPSAPWWAAWPRRRSATGWTSPSRRCS